MQYFDQMPILFGAIQYSLAYLLLGGGVLGAMGIFAGAKILGK